MSIMHVISIAFIASIPLFLLYAAGAGMRRRPFPATRMAGDLLGTHLNAVLFFGVCALLVWFNTRFQLGVANGPLLLAQIATACLLILVGIYRRGFAQSMARLATTYLYGLLLCLLSASIYALTPAPPETHFVPAIANNDVFAYLLRGHALFEHLRLEIAHDVSNVTPIEALNSSSKLASAYFLSFFLWISDNLGYAAAAASVAVRAALVHLLWGLYRPRTGSRFGSASLLLFLVFAPSLVLLSLLFHLSQLIFIYLCLLTLFSARRLAEDPIHQAMLCSTILILLSLVLYPAAFPLLLAILFFSIYYACRRRQRAIPWARLAFITGISIAGIALIGYAGLLNTDFRHHLTGDDFYPVGYFPLIGHWLAPLAFGSFVWAAMSPLIQQLVGLCFDLLFLWFLLRSARVRVTQPLRSPLSFALLALLASWAFYQLVFILTDGNYKAFKLDTILVTTLSLVITGLLHRELPAKARPRFAWVLLFLTCINLSTLTTLSLQRSVPRAMDEWIQEIAESERQAIFYAFESYRANMYLPLVLTGKSLRPLRKTYYPASDLTRVCEESADQTPRVFVTRETMAQLQGEVVKEYGAGILAVSPKQCRED